jgi:hypothetical protein
LITIQINDESANIYGAPQFEDIRKTLLNQYHSHVTTHTGLIIAIIIGSLTLLSRWDSFFKDATPIFVFLLTFSFIVGLTFYVLGRLSYWASISNSILIMKQKHFESYFMAFPDEPCICSAQVLAHIMTVHNQNNSWRYNFSRLSVSRLFFSSVAISIVTYFVLSLLVVI